MIWLYTLRRFYVQNRVDISSLGCNMHDLRSTFTVHWLHRKESGLAQKKEEKPQSSKQSTVMVWAQLDSLTNNEVRYLVNRKTMHLRFCRASREIEGVREHYSCRLRFITSLLLHSARHSKQVSSEISRFFSGMEISDYFIQLRDFHFVRVRPTTLKQWWRW